MLKNKQLLLDIHHPFFEHGDDMLPKQKNEVNPVRLNQIYFAKSLASYLKSDE